MAGEMATGKKVRKLFYQWKRFVLRSLRATRKDTLHRLNNEYEQLYDSMLLACRDEIRQTYAPQVMRLVKPWAELGVLAHTEKPILRDIIKKCERIETEHHWRHVHLRRRRRLGPILAFATICLFGYLLYVGTQQPDGWGTIVSNAGNLGKALLKLLGNPIALSIVAVFVVVIGLFATRYNTS